MILPADMAPDFITLPREDGRDLTLSSLRSGAVVLYFYPRDDTPGCIREALDFTARSLNFTAGRSL
jgi:thioredoxin-dependent peroxiredoxin